MKKLITGIGLIGAGYCVGWLKGLCGMAYLHGAIMVENENGAQLANCDHEKLYEAEKRFYRESGRLHDTLSQLFK